MTGFQMQRLGMVMEPEPGNPLEAELAIIWIIGTYAIVFGALLMILAFRFRRHINQIED